MKQAEFDAASGGMAPEGLAAALRREAPVAGRTWQATDPMPAGPRTVQAVRTGLETALRQGNGIAIVFTAKQTAGGTYAHWVVVRGLEGGKVLVHDPEMKKAVLRQIVAGGFGEYQWAGDTVLAAAGGP